MSSTEGRNYGPAVHKTSKYLFFYGYELQVPESRLQNWYPASFTDETNPSIRFATGEHYIMYRKALAMNDHETAARVLIAATPSEANKLGREIKSFDSAKWRGMVAQVAEDLGWLKFSQVKECREVLLGTGDRVLVEASPLDRNWGIGFAGDKAEGREEEWGKNLAGEALMRVRDRLRKEEEK